MINFKLTIEKFLIIIGILFLCDFDALSQDTQGNFEEYTVDKTIKGKFENALKKSQFKLPMPAEGFFFIVSKKSDKELFDNAAVFFDTIKTFIDVPY